MSNSEKGHLREPSPLLKDLQEKKQNFKRMASEVGSMASELRDVRSRMAAQEASLARESACRQAAESKARSMERELHQLQKSLEERNTQVQSSTSVAEQVKMPDGRRRIRRTDPLVPESILLDATTSFESLNKWSLSRYLRELEDVRSKLATAQSSADTSATSAQAAQKECSELLKELDKKNTLLQEHEGRVTRLGQQLDELQQDLVSRETFQKHLKEEVLKIEQEIKLAVAKAGENKDCELRKLLEEVSAKNIENLAKHLSTKEEEIARLREEIKMLSAQWKLKTQELEAQLEKQRRADQELKKRVLKLEFCLQEARSQTRKLQRIGERRDKAIKELREQLQMRENGSAATDKPSFWESSGFKFVVSMSMIVLVVFAKR